MKSRYAGGIIYFLVIVSTLLMRISGSVGVYDALNVDADVYFTCIVQILCFGALPIIGYFIVAKQCRCDEIKSLLVEFNIQKCSLRGFGLCLAAVVPTLLISSFISFVWQNVLALTGYLHATPDPVVQTPANLVVDIFLVAVLPGIFEEITHRGLVFAAYRETGCKVVLVSGLLFALMHQNITQTGYTFFIGVIAALMVYYTGSLLPAVFLHFFNNFISVLGDYTTLSPVFAFISDARNWLFGNLLGLLVCALLMIASVVAVCLLFRVLRQDAVKQGRLPVKTYEKPWVGAIPLHRDVPFIVTVCVGVCATAFSFVWRLVL